MKRLLPLLFVMVAIFYCGESEGREWVSFESDDVYHMPTMKTALRKQARTR